LHRQFSNSSAPGRRPCLPAVVLMSAIAASCTTTLPTSSDIPTSTVGALLSASANTNIVVGAPRLIYRRIARQASRCWFGPFGNAHDRYMTSADVPPPSSSAPVKMSVHRRLKNRKKPWGPALLRIEMSGATTTTITYQNVALDTRTLSLMTEGFTRWANGRTDCITLQGADPQWAPTPVPTTQRRANKNR
jgi:hypothetical protein